jgi:hypothetical protein
LALLVDLVGWLLLLIAAAVDENVLLHGAATPWMYLLYVLSVVALLGVIAILVHTWRSWRPPQRGMLVRVGETLLALAAMYLAWFILAFGLVSFNVRY